MLDSIRKYLASLGVWGWLVYVINIFSMVNLGYNLTGNPIFVIPTWGWLIFLIIGLIIAPFFAFHKLQTKLNRIKNARPNIVILGIRNIQTAIRNMRTGEILGEPHFTQILFANDPLTPLQAVDATNVAGHIDIYKKDGKHLFYMIGRWSETKEEVRGAQPFEMEQITIPPNGRANPIDVVLKYRGDEEGYGHNNESRKIAPTDWRDNQKPLPAGNYSVRVRLRGTNVDKVFWLNLVNKGKGKDIEFEAAVYAPSIPDTQGSQN